jgi:hypothetical protein
VVSVRIELVSGVVGVVGTVVVSVRIELVSGVVGVVGAIVVSALIPVSAGVWTVVVSPRAGAAPVSSSARLWQAASVAAAARIQIAFIWCHAPQR